MGILKLHLSSIISLFFPLKEDYNWWEITFFYVFIAFMGVMLSTSA